MRYFRLFLVCAALLFAAYASAEERILNYDVDIQIQQNADLIVTENITVNSEGRSIRRGIFRDLPRYKIDEGDMIPYQYKILSVTKNGEKEPFDKSSDGNAKRVRIGDEDVYLQHGEYTYVIKYRVKNEIRYGETSDELYWNVTGNYWNFAIEEASVSVTLPGDTPARAIKEITGYAGRLGTNDVPTTISSRFNPITVEAARALRPREGLTVLVRFDKGLIDPPSTADKTMLWWFKNGALFFLSFSFAGLVFYYYRAWNKVGRDPQEQAIYPRYSPPEGYSAGAVHHLSNRLSGGSEALISTLMSLAVKGAIRIDSKKKSTTFQKLGDNQLSAPLLTHEQFLYDRLFKGSAKTITLKGKPHAGFHKTRTAFTARLAKDYGDKYFRWNAGYTVAGIVLSAAAMLIAITQIYGLWKQGFVIVFAALLALNILFIFLMPAPTKRGQKITAEIEGFKLYLKTAESKRFAETISGNPADAPPTMTQELYERYLPYAVALDVEKPWSKYFEKMLPREAENYSPAWGDIHNARGGASSFSKSLNSNLSSGVLSAAPQSSSSSGGGSSGGGGGGGGGGGW